MYKMKVTYEVMLGLAAEMVWDQVLREHRMNELHMLIDQALVERDQDSFQRLTDELRTLASAVVDVEPMLEIVERKSLSF